MSAPIIMIIIGYDASKINPDYPQGQPSGYQGMPPPSGPQYGKI